MINADGNGKHLLRRGHLVCNKLGIDLYTALKDKEEQNVNREWC